MLEIDLANFSNSTILAAQIDDVEKATLMHTQADLCLLCSHHRICFLMVWLINTLLCLMPMVNT